MFYANLGTQYPNKDILYVAGIKTIGVELHTGETAEDLNEIIQTTQAKRIMFSHSSLPRKAVPVTHPKTETYIKKFVKLT